MNILLATDNNFVQHCCVTITSVLLNNTDVVVFLFTDDLTASNEKLLQDQTEKLGGTLIVRRVDGETIAKFPMPKTSGNAHISVATYYRLFVEELLPLEVDRILYLDCDMIINESLEELYKTDITNYALAAVYQHNEWAETYKVFERLDYPKDKGYFNAGMLLINLDYWRSNNVTKRLMDFIKFHYDRILSHDQDVLNAVLHDETLPVSYKWNYTPIFLNMDRFTFLPHLNYVDGLKPVIIHFVSRPKPWQYYCKHPYKQLYFDYLSQTPFNGWRPKNSWKEFKEYKLIPFIIRIDKLKIRYLFITPKKEIQ